MSNREAMLTKLASLDAEHAKAVAGGGEKYVERHRSRGKLTARERVEWEFRSQWQRGLERVDHFQHFGDGHAARLCVGHDRYGP